MCEWTGSAHLTAAASPKPEMGYHCNHICHQNSFSNMSNVGRRGHDLLGVTLKHQVLLALVQSTLLQSPEMKHSVFPLEQFTEDPCTHRHTPS